MSRAVYGDMLAFFPELIKRFVIYEKSPTLIAGHTDKLNIRETSGILQFCKAGDVVINGNTLNDVDAPLIWSRSEIGMNTYIEADGTEYRRTKNNKFVREGGFYIYVLESVVGNTDTQTPELNVNLGIYR